MFQIQHFVCTLEKVSHNLEAITRMEYRSGSFDTEPIERTVQGPLDGSFSSAEDEDKDSELNELQAISQLMLISKIRQNCSKEFISIVDQIIISEYDELND